MSIIALNQSVNSLVLQSADTTATNTTAVSSETNSRKRDHRASKAPDGGYSWVILAAVFMLNFLLDGCMYSFGIILPEIKKNYDISQGSSNLIISINTGFLYCSGMIAYALVDQFGCRAVVMFSAAVAALMNLIVAFVSESYLIILTYGAIGGIATGCTFLVGFIVLVQYFDKRLGLATGISTSGSGVGAFIIPLLTKFIIAKFDWKLTMIVYGCLILNCVVLGALMRPVQSPKSKNLTKATETEPLKHHEAESKKTSTICQIVLKIVKETFNFRLLVKNFSFAMISISTFFYALTFFIPFIFVPIRGEELFGSKCTWVISVIGLVNIPGRIIFGILADKTSIAAVDMNTLCSLLMTITYLVYFFLNEFWMQIVYAIVYAISMAGMSSLCTPYLCQMVGNKRFANANGILNIAKGAACVAGPILAGIIYDKSKSALYPYMFGAICCALSFLFSLIASIWSFVLRRRRASNSQSFEFAKN